MNDSSSFDAGHDTREAAALAVLRRVYELASGDATRDVAWSRALDGRVGSYLEARSVLGVLLQNGWIVRLDRDVVTITPAGIDAVRG